MNPDSTACRVWKSRRLLA